MDAESDGGRGFGLAVRDLRVAAGLSLNQLARRAGVDPAYIHRIESRSTERPPLPRRGVVVAIAEALELDRRRADQLLAQAGYAPRAVVELGWDETLAQVAELLADGELSGAARAEFREIVRILARRWGRAESTS